MVKPVEQVDVNEREAKSSTLSVQRHLSWWSRYDHSFADDLLEEAGLRIAWPVPRRCNDSIQEEDDWLRDGDSGIAISPQSLKKFGDMVESRSGSLSKVVDLDEDASEFQPFLSTASIMFSVSADGTTTIKPM
ncbi:hypothetical protein Moror_1332 [Moniliophthora roreri MCA 2997]|uniref:Uncharacterized protein n=1 Tax=Moniliophthora roreri (strain MCA 2997) TaxID=1381753 RepID=V2WH40_MONRO|nr:hypothetical protein Moror_1332 [Moniliophthora roreri MCA 2997]